MPTQQASKTPQQNVNRFDRGLFRQRGSLLGLSRRENTNDPIDPAEINIERRRGTEHTRQEQIYENPVSGLEMTQWRFIDKRGSG